MKSLICDVIPDCDVLVGRQNRTINPQELIFPSKLSQSSLMGYIYIADEKGKRFIPIVGRIDGGIHQTRLLLAKIT